MEHSPAALDIFAPDISMSILTWLTFIILLGILHKFAWKPILAGLDKREAYIRQSLAEADQAKTQLAQIEQQKIELLEQAKIQSNAIIDQSRKSAADVARGIEQKAKKTAEDILLSARQQIDGEREKARHALKEESAKTAVRLAEIILKENLDSEKNRQLIKTSMKDVQDL